MRLPTRHEQGSSRSHRDTAVPGACNWVTILRPEDDSGHKEGEELPEHGGGRDWVRRAETFS